MQSCHLSNGVNGDIEQITNELIQTREDISKANGEWEWRLDQLKKDLGRETNDTARLALDEVNITAQRTTQAAGAEMRCSAASVKNVALQSLNNTIERINGRPVPDIEPNVCTFSPSVIDLSADQVRTLAVSGTFFFSTHSPQITVRSKGGETKIIPADLISKQTDYMMVIKVEEAMQRKIITEDSTALLLSFPMSQSKLVHEVPIQSTPQCDDGVRNGSGINRETDIDCGGARCAKCSVGKSCYSDSDCKTNACDNGRCAAHHLVAPILEEVFGGNGLGTGDNIVVCPGNYLVTGFKTYTGNWFDRFGVKCALFNADGTVGPERFDTDLYGDPGGNTTTESTCNEGRVLYGITGKVYDGPASVQGLCALPSEIAKHPPLLATKDVSKLIAPSGQGGPVTTECPAGYAMVGLRVHYVDLISKLWIECEVVSRSGPSAH